MSQQPNKLENCVIECDNDRQKCIVLSMTDITNINFFDAQQCQNNHLSCVDNCLKKISLES